MKQLLFMIVMTAVGTFGTFLWGPFAAVSVYYLFAVLRPQALWIWALPYGVPWSEYQAIVAIIGAVFVASHSTGGAAVVRRTTRAIGPWMLLAFGIWVFGSYLNAEDPDRAYGWMLEYLKIMTMFAVATVVVRNSRQIWILFLIATISLAYIAYEMNFEYLVNGYLYIYKRGYGGLDNNGAGLMIAMGIPLGLYAWEATRGWWRWLYLASIGPMLHAVLMSYSRGAMVALLVTAPLMIARTRFRGQMSLVVITVAAMIPVLAGQQIRDRFFSIEQYQEDGSANSRMMSWKAAVRIANEYPILGAGPRNSNLLSYEYGADRVGRTIHSQYLQTAADLGWVGLAFYLGVVLSAWRSLSIARALLRRRSDDEANRLLSVTSGVQCSLAVFLVGAFFLSLEVFELPYLLMLMGFLLRRICGEVTAESAELAPTPAGAGHGLPQFASAR